VLLVVDAGNTQTHLGTFEGEELIEHWRFATVRTSTADELGAALRALLELRGMTFEHLDAAIVSSTVPELVPEWQQMAERYLGHPMPAVGPGLRTGMPIRIDNPREVGPDRLVNAIAAYEVIQGTCIVVDFGTALTYDAVSEGGEYLGGIISPGVEISMEALTARAARLRKIDLAAPRSLIGKSTEDAMRAGLVYGFAAQVDGIVTRMRDELGQETEAIATGGLAHRIVPYCEAIDDVDELLTLTGLRIIHERNLEPAGD
jgi:type III pantothenate kinase